MHGSVADTSNGAGDVHAGTLNLDLLIHLFFQARISGISVMIVVMTIQQQQW